MTNSDTALQNSKGSPYLDAGSPNRGAGSHDGGAGSQDGGTGSGIRLNLTPALFTLQGMCNV